MFCDARIGLGGKHMTKIFGHRGASGYAPENTLEAFRLAAEMKADGVELDVQLTRDGEIVVIHDEIIDRTSDHQGKVMDYTLEQLRGFNFNNKNENYEFCRIPTLKEVLELLEPTELKINVELKTGIFHYPGIEEKVLELVDSLNMNSRIIYSSFNHNTVRKIREMRPDAYCGMLHNDVIINLAGYAKMYGMNALHPIKYSLLDDEYIAQARQFQLDINSWTINTEQEITMALKKGIDVLITNYPDRALAIRKQLTGK